MKSFLHLTLALFVLSKTYSAPDKKGAYYKLEDAVKEPDFAIQGEYSGTYTKSNGDEAKVGIQVVALGNGLFRAIGFEGGLPGNGWDLGKKAISEAQKSDDGSVTFKKDDGVATAIIKNGKLHINGFNGNILGTLEKVERESSTLGMKPPKGAISLFDGTSLDHWKPGARMSEDKLLMEGVNSVRNNFKNFTLHLEFRLPYMPKARGQSRGNSGMYLLGTETQMLDSFGLSGEPNECGGLYKWRRPDINMCYPPLRWQTYDVDFKASEGGKPSIMTVKHNGVVIHDKIQLKNRNSQGNIHLQNHGNPVRYRNIWILEKD